MAIDNKEYKVYVHTNLLNGKQYVGQTKLPVEIRWGKNGQKYKGSIYFYNAIQKYGWHNFSHEIIADNLTLDEANTLEKLLIEKLQTRNPNFGYNISYGGDNKTITDITKQKWRDCGRGTKGRKVMCEGKEFLSVSQCARYYGIKRESMKNWLNKKNNMPQKFIDMDLHYVGENTYYKAQEDNQQIITTHKPVVCEDKIFVSMRECADYYGIKYHTLVGWMSGAKRMPQMFIDKNLHFVKESNIKYEPQVRDRWEM